MTAETVLVPFAFELPVCRRDGLFLYGPVTGSALGKIEHVEVRAAKDLSFAFHQARHVRIHRLATVVASDMFGMVILSKGPRGPYVWRDRLITTIGDHQFMR